MPDLNDEILTLKGKGMSLRRIAAVIGLSHTTVMRRVREMEQVSLPGIVTGKAGSKPHQSRICGKSEETLGKVSHKELPSVMPGDGVTPCGKARRGPYGGKKEGNSSRSDNLVGNLIRFLEDKGLEVYPMQNGGYQVKGDLETIRFYISRRDG